MMTSEDMSLIKAQAECLCNAADVEQAYAKMAAEITAVLAEHTPLCLCVVTGGIIPTGQLLPLLDFPLQLDYIHASRYRNSTEGKELQWRQYPSTLLQGRHVLLIDDILDEGLTMQAVREYCLESGAEQVYTAVLADKEGARHPEGLQQADFTGLYIPNRYVFGCGLDYKGYWRNANGIYAVRGL